MSNESYLTNSLIISRNNEILFDFSVYPIKVSIEAYHINGEGYWQLKEYKDITELLVLNSIQVSLPLVEIYKRTKVVGELG